MINVLMVDNNTSTIKEVKQYFSSQKNICITGSYTNSKDALEELIKNDSYDVILMDLLISPLDSISFLASLKEHNINKKIIVYSNYSNYTMVNSLLDYDISFYLLKSIDMNVLKERIIDATNIKYQQYEFKDNYLVNKVSKLLHDLGMPSHIKGYQYIRDSILLMNEDKEYIGAITKKLYPEIAKKYQTTSSRVERAIRHAIEVSWNRGDYDLMDEIFGHSVDFDRAKPTNSEFIATLADKIELDENKFIKYKNYN
jgi:two-component system response regulator (stage 0 sporulation protein A)